MMNRGPAIVALSPLTDHVYIIDINRNPHTLLTSSLKMAKTAHPANARTSTGDSSYSEKSAKPKVVFQTRNLSGGAETLSRRLEVVSGRRDITRGTRTTAAWR